MSLSVVLFAMTARKVADVVANGNTAKRGGRGSLRIV